MNQWPNQQTDAYGGDTIGGGDGGDGFVNLVAGEEITADGDGGGTAMGGHGGEAQMSGGGGDAPALTVEGGGNSPRPPHDATAEEIAPILQSQQEGMAPTTTAELLEDAPAVPV